MIKKLLLVAACLLWLLAAAVFIAQGVKADTVCDFLYVTVSAR